MLTRDDTGLARIRLRGTLLHIMPWFSRRCCLAATRRSSFKQARCGLGRLAIRGTRRSGGNLSTSPAPRHRILPTRPQQDVPFLPCAPRLFFHDHPPGNFHILQTACLNLERATRASENHAGLVKRGGQAEMRGAGPVRSQSDCCQLICFQCCINTRLASRTTRIIYRVLLTSGFPPCP